jgi:polysaccharide biosynthesis transport protein
MTIITLFRILLRNLKWLLPMGIISAAMVFHLTKDTPKEYESYTILNTGLVSGYNIESQSSGRIDFGYTNSEMENILGVAKSRETHEELAAQLLAQALMQKEPSVAIINAPALSALKKDIPQKTITQVVDYQSFENTLANVKSWRDTQDKNPIKTILESTHPLFGIEHIDGLSIKREGNSDMIRIAYATTDPSVCRNTLRLLTDIFIAKHRSVKEGQSSDVVAFFENATRESASTLNGREDNMLAFMVQNKIINYYEQTRFIAAKKEDLDEMYFKEMMHLAAADSSRRHLEQQLTKYVNLPNINQTLLKQRSDLSNVSARLAHLEIGLLDDSTATEDDIAFTELHKQTDRIKNDLRKQAEATYATIRTPEGVEIKNVLSQWLNQFIEVEQGLARLNVFKERKTEFDRVYGRFAPWGSKIKRMEREIEVSEKAYLENLRSFNQARLHRYNMIMTANLRVVDAPYMPDKPKPSKRAMLLIMGFLAGVVLPLVGLIVTELLDKSLKTPENAVETTGLELLSALPKLPPNWEKDKVIDYKTTMRKATNQLVQNIKVELRDRQKQLNQPPKIAVVGTRGKEGKSFITALLETYNTEFYFIELPSLLSERYYADMDAHFDLVLVIANANFSWNNADKKALTAISKVTNTTCHLVLNKVRIDNLESSLGEIPKRRSAFRRWFNDTFYHINRAKHGLC